MKPPKAAPVVNPLPTTIITATHSRRGLYFAHQRNGVWHNRAKRGPRKESDEKHLLNIRRLSRQKRQYGKT
jgi:hypothetical protein